MNFVAPLGTVNETRSVTMITNLKIYLYEIERWDPFRIFFDTNLRFPVSITGLITFAMTSASTSLITFRQRFRVTTSAKHMLLFRRTGTSTSTKPSLESLS